MDWTLSGLCCDICCCFFYAVIYIKLDVNLKVTFLNRKKKELEFNLIIIKNEWEIISILFMEQYYAMSYIYYTT